VSICLEKSKFYPFNLGLLDTADTYNTPSRNFGSPLSFDNRNMPKEYRCETLKHHKLCTHLNIKLLVTKQITKAPRGATPVYPSLRHFPSRSPLRSSTNGLNWLPGLHEILCNVLGKVCQARGPSGAAAGSR
jgi:hypothetical protein